MKNIGGLKWTLLAGVFPAVLLAINCSGGSTAPSAPLNQVTVSPQPTATPQPSPSATPAPTEIKDDAGLFDLITRTDPFSAYRVFPNTDEFTTGRLDGSEAHQPVVRVSLNAIAFGALQNGKLPTGAKFPNGSVIVKQVLQSAGGGTRLYAVMRKDAGGSQSGADWQWAEYRPDGSVDYPITSRGNACYSCHSRGLGPKNDLVRTFERQ